MSDAIGQANQDLVNGVDPSQSLGKLTASIAASELASGDLTPLDETVRLAISIQNQSIAWSTMAAWREASSKNFTAAVTDLNDFILASNRAFWGLESISRDEAINHIQINMDDTLFLLADNLNNDAKYVDRRNNLGVRYLASITS